jgi:hypothetical protein
VSLAHQLLTLCLVPFVPFVPSGDAVQVQLLPVSKIAVSDLGNDWLTIYQGPDLSTSWSSLRAGCKYQLRVASRNAVGYSQFSVPVSFMTAPDAPLPPPKPSALIDKQVSTHVRSVQTASSGLAKRASWSL